MIEQASSMTNAKLNSRPIVILVNFEIYDEVHQLDVIDEAKIKSNIQTAISSFQLSQYLSNRKNVFFQRISIYSFHVVDHI